MSENLSILVIDDEKDFIEMVQAYLDMSGIAVKTASNGPDGITLAKKFQPSVILLDVSMPEMNGLEVLKILKDDPKTQNLPIIMLTAMSTMGDIDDAFALGADDYITKPIDFKKLPARVKEKLTKISR